MSSTSSNGAAGASSAQVKEWSPVSWRKYPIKQQPLYPDQAALEKAVSKVRSLPPLVSVKEIWNLRKQLAEVADGKRFLIQGGDCAERFADCTAESLGEY